MDDLELHHSVSQFLFHEARLLDERLFTDWLDLWTEDASYLLPTTWVSNLEGIRSASDLELHHLRSSKAMLNLRVAKLNSGSAWAEDPPSRMVRNISNIEARERDGIFQVRSNAILHRVRHTDDVEIHAAVRLDELVRVERSWRIAFRRVDLAHGVLHAANLEFFL